MSVNVLYIMRPYPRAQPCEKEDKICETDVLDENSNGQQKHHIKKNGPILLVDLI